jgi:cytidine diphosphoramidate kinase
MQPIGVIWITGLSSSGKTTVAHEVLVQLRQRHIASVMLDGDAVRDAIQDANVGYDRDSRLTNAYRICRLARMLSSQDIVVVAATMSLYHEIHDWNRRNLLGYWEVYVKADLEQCRARDPKNIYKMALNGLMQDVVGIELTPELPLRPHMVVENSGGLNDVPRIAKSIIEAFISDRTKAHAGT